MALLERLRMAPQIEDEITTELPRDPEPGEPAPTRARRQTATRAAAPVKAPTATKLAKQVADDLASLLQGTAAIWSLSDQCCAPVLDAQSTDIAKAFTAILARNPALLAKLAHADTAVLAMQAIALGRALAPLGKAVYSNHVAKTGVLADDSLDLSQFTVPGYPA